MESRPSIISSLYFLSQIANMLASTFPAVKEKKKSLGKSGGSEKHVDILLHRKCLTAS